PVILTLSLLLPLTTSLSFFFHCSAAPPYLHSFPTRRSSDLFLLHFDGRPLLARNLYFVLVLRVTGIFSADARNVNNAAVVDVPLDRKSTRLNSSHVKISYAVFCLKKKKKSRPHDKSMVDSAD